MGTGSDSLVLLHDSLRSMLEPCGEHSGISLCDPSSLDRDKDKSCGHKPLSFEIRTAFAFAGMRYSSAVLSI